MKVSKIIRFVLGAMLAVLVCAVMVTPQKSDAGTVTIMVTNSTTGVFSTNIITVAADGSFNPTVLTASNITIVVSNSLNGIQTTNVFTAQVGIGYSFGVSGGKMSFYSQTPVTQQTIAIGFNTNGIDASALSGVVSNLIRELKVVGLLQ